MSRAVITAALILCASAALPLLAAEQKAPRSGEELYRTHCGNCHGSGWQGAPIAYDEHDWSPRAKQGIDVLLSNAKKGLNSMPPMGTCMDCSDEELKAAIQEMLRF